MWIRDEYGRIGELNEKSQVVKYAYGEHPIRCKYVTAKDLSYEFFVQRDKMWKAVSLFDSLSRRCLERLGVRKGSYEFEELISDVGVPAVCTAVVMFDHRRGAGLKTFVRKCLDRAYRRAIATRRHSTALPDQPPAAHDQNLLGLISREQLSTIVEQAGITEDELHYLMLRYDSELSLRDLAEEMGVASPTTALNVVNRILERCRQASSTTPQ